MAPQEPQYPGDSDKLSDDVNGALDMDVSVQVEESQVHDVDAGFSNQTQAADEEAVHETQPERSEPQSDDRDSMPRDQVKPIHVEFPDHVALQDITSYNETDFSPENRLLKRPSSAGSQAAPSFSFTRHSQPHMDFTGKLRGPASSVLSTSRGFDEPAIIAEANAGSPDDPAVSDDMQMAEDPTECNGVVSDVTTEEDQVVSLAHYSAVKKERKHGNLSWYKSAQERLDDNDDVAPTVQHTSNQGMPVETKQPSPGSNDGLESELYRQHSPQKSRPELDEQELAPAAESLSSQSPHRRGTVSESEADIIEQQVAPNHQPAASVQHVQENQAQQPATRIAAADQHNDVPESRDLHHPSDSHRNSRVSKPKTKHSQNAAAQKQVATTPANDPLVDINDYMQVAWFKVNQLRQHYETEAVHERETFASQLHQVCEVRDTLQDQLDVTLRVKESQAITINEQAKKIADYGLNVKRFKVFIDGLGNDINSLKKDAAIHSRKREELRQQITDLEEQRESLRDQLSTWETRTADLKTEMAEARSKAQTESQNAGALGKYLEQQLSEKVGMLAEERDRRSQLEKQLALRLSSEGEVTELLASSRDAILDKLTELCTHVRETGGTGISGALKEILEGMQALDSRAGCTVEEMATTKDMVEQLKQTLSEHLQNTISSQNRMSEDSLQTHLDEAINSLKEDLAQRDNWLQQDAARQEHSRELEEKLKETKDRLTVVDADLAGVQENERKLQEENRKLQTRLTGLQDRVAPTEDAHAQLNEVQIELNDKIKLLEAANVDSANKTEQMRAMSVSNTELKQQISSLQHQPADDRSHRVELAEEKQRLERKAREEVEKVQKDMDEHIRQFEAELKTQTSNELKRLTGERNRLEKKVKPLTEELSTCKTRIQDLEKELRSGSASNHAESEKLKSLTQSQKEEIKTLQTSLNTLTNAAKSDASLKKDYTALAAQFESERQRLLQIGQDNSALTKQVENLRRSGEEAKVAGDQVKVQLDQCRIDSGNAIKALENELTEKRQAINRSQAGHEQLKKSCQDAIDDTNSKCERQVRALQERLSEAEGEVQAGRESAEKFRAEVEQGWEQLQQDFETTKSELRTKISEVETERDEALQSNIGIQNRKQKDLDEQRKLLEERISEALRKAAVAEDQMKLMQQRPMENPNDSVRIRVPTIAEHITPTEGLENGKVPTRPRKKVDRINNTTIEDGPLPAPEELRPASGATNLKGTEKTGGPLVDESQDVADFYTAPTHQSAMVAPKRTTQASFLPSDDMLSFVDDSQRPGPVVEETQQQEELPSFAAVTSNFGTFSQPFELDSFPSMTSQTGLRDYDHIDSYERTWPEGQSQYINKRPTNSKVLVEDSQPAAFAVYEDPQSDRPTANTHSGQLQRQGSLPWSQEEKDNFTFRKPFPPPNSASKRIRQIDPRSATAKQPLGPSPNPATREPLKIPGLGLRKESSELSDPPTSAKSSTSSFVPSGSARKLTTYQNSGGSAGMRRSSRTQSNPIADPRLAARKQPPAQKRKAEPQIFDGYEQERKKRTRAQTQSTSTAITSFPTMLSGSMSSQKPSSSSNSGPRMRNLAGGSSRTVKGTKKLSKKDEYSARFSQELNR